MLFVLLKDINKLNCKEIGILTNRANTTIHLLQNRATNKLHTSILFQKEYLVLTETINQRNKRYERIIKLS